MYFGAFFAKSTKIGSMDDDRRRVTAFFFVVAGGVVYAALTFVWFSLPAYLSVIIEEIGLTGTEAGILVGAVPLTYIPLALFSGLAVDRIGPSRSLAIALVIFGTAQWARSFATDFATLLVATLMLGVGATIVTFGLPKLVAVLFPPDQTGVPSSIYLVGSAAGSGIAYAIGRPVLGPLLGGWRPLFYWSGIGILIGAIIWILLVWRLWPENSTAGGPSSLDVSRIRQDLTIVLTHRELRLVVVLGMTYLLVIHGLQGWLPTILESRGMSPTWAGYATTLLVAANVAGVLTIPGLADRYSARRLAVMSSSAVVGLGAFAIMIGDTTVIAIGGIIAAGIGVGGLSPMVRAIPPALDGIGARRTATAVGLVFAVGEVGGFFGPLLIGMLYDLTASYTPGLAILTFSGVTALIAGNRLRSIDKPTALPS